MNLSNIAILLSCVLNPFLYDNVSEDIDTLQKNMIDTYKTVKQTTDNSIYLEAGNIKSDKLVLFLHSSVGVEGCFQFFNLFQCLDDNEEFHFIAPTYPEHVGNNTRFPDNKQNLNSVCEFIISFLKNLRYKELYIIGHSFGGNVAATLKNYNLPIKTIIYSSNPGYLHSKDFFRYRYKSLPGGDNSISNFTIKHIVTYQIATKYFTNYIVRSLPFIIQSYIRAWIMNYNNIMLMNNLINNPLFYVKTPNPKLKCKEFVLCARRKGHIEDPTWIPKHILSKIPHKIVYVNVPLYGYADNKLIDEWGHYPFIDNVNEYKYKILKILTE